MGASMRVPRRLAPALVVFTVLTVLGLVPAAACRKKPSDVDAGEGVQKIPGAGLPKPVKKFRGYYMPVAEGAIFRECGTGALYWVTGDRFDLEDARSDVKPAYTEEGVVAEVVGYLDDPPRSGTGAMFGGTLRVISLEEAAEKTYENACHPWDYWGIGSVPRWSIQISRMDHVIVLKDFSRSIAAQFSYEDPRMAGDVITWDLDYKGRKLKVKLERKPCRDPLSGQSFEFMAEAVLDGRTYLGCALAGPAITGKPYVPPTATPAPAPKATSPAASPLRTASPKPA